MPANSSNAPPAAASAQYVDPLSGQSLAPEQVPGPVRRIEFRGAVAIAGLLATMLRLYSVDKSSEYLLAYDNAVTGCISRAMNHASTLLAAGGTVHRHHFDLYSVLITVFVLGFACSLAKEGNATCPSGKWMNADGSCLDCSVVQTAYQKKLCPCEANRDAVITCKEGINPLVMDCQQYDNGVKECWGRQEHVEHTTSTTLSPTDDSATASMEAPARATTPSDATSSFITTEVGIAVYLIAVGVRIVVVVVVAICFLCLRNKFLCEVNRYAILPQTKKDCMTIDRELSKRCTPLSGKEQEADAAYSAPRRPVPNGALLAEEEEAAVTADEEAAAQAATLTEMTIVLVEAEAAATAEMTTVELEAAKPVVATVAAEAVTAATVKTVVSAETATLAEATTSYWTLSRLRQPAVT